MMKTYYPSKPYVSVYDPIPYFGGSKVASEAYLELLQDEGVSIEIFTQHPDSWRHKDFNVTSFTEFSGLASCEYGLKFYLKNLCLSALFFIHILGLIAKYRKLPEFYIGASGPGIDVALYPVAKLLFGKIIQLIHGPVGQSRLTTKLLGGCDLIGHLPSSRKTVTNTIKDSNNKIKIVEFENGISKINWPSKCKNRFESPNIFWAASLLKWKGLDLFVEAFRNVSENTYSSARIAYIRPCRTQHAVCVPPEDGPKLKTYESPKNLDELRSESNIFVSTAHGEPFGLSILEALATGLCVVIPTDGAYWDKRLTHGYNCIKYQPDSVDSLSEKLRFAANNMKEVKRMAARGQQLSTKYRSETTYRNLVLASLEESRNTAVLSDEII